MASETGPILDEPCNIRTSPDTVPGNFCANLRHFVEEKEVRIKAILDNLGWTREYIEQHITSMVQCPLDPGHWMPDTSLPSHLEECKRRRSGVDFSGYESPTDTSYCYRDKPNVVQVGVDESCWEAIEAEVTKNQKLKPIPSSSSDVPAVWLDLDHCDSSTLTTANGNLTAEPSELSVKLKVVKGEGQELQLVPDEAVETCKSGSSTSIRSSVLGSSPVPVEYDLVSRSVDARRIMYDNVIAATKPYTIVQGYGISDEDLVRNDYKTEAKRLKYEQGISDAKSIYEKLAEERDRRRRRQKYRAKNIASNRSIKEIYKAIIEKRMAECSAIEESEHLGGHHSDKDCQLKTIPSGSSRYDGDCRLSETGKLELHQQHIIDNDNNTVKDHSGRKRYRTTDERGRNQSRSRTSDRDDDEYKRRRESRHSTDLESACHEHERHRHKNKHKKHKKH